MCYLAAPRPSLVHCQGDSVANKMLHYVTILIWKVTGILAMSLDV